MGFYLVIWWHGFISDAAGDLGSYQYFWMIRKFKTVVFLSNNKNHAFKSMTTESVSFSKKLALATFAVLASFSLQAANISGQWRADIETPNGLHKVLYNFQVEGSKLTGTAIDEANGSRREGHLTEGTFTNNLVSFVTYYEADTGDTLRIEYNGTPGTNEIHFLAQVANVTTLDFIATRVESANAINPVAYASGIWSWTTPGRNGGPDYVSKLTLTQEQGKLTGKISAPVRSGAVIDLPISNGKAEDGKVQFDVVRELNGNTFASSYSGEVSADKITGQINFNRNGEVQTYDWVAKRAAESK
jgi:hypothetical protein